MPTNNFFPLEATETSSAERMQDAGLMSVAGADPIETQKTAAGSVISSFLENFFRNMDARSLNNQAIAQYNLEQAAAAKARQNQNMIMIFAIIIIFVFVVISKRK